MAIDLGRIARAVVEAAIQDRTSSPEKETPKRHSSGARALLVGAGLVTVGRLAAPKGREILSSLQQQLVENPDEPEAEAEEDVDDEDEYDEEPEAEAEEDVDDEDEYDEEPEAEADGALEETEPEDPKERPKSPRRTRARSRS